VEEVEEEEELMPWQNALRSKLILFFISRDLVDEGYIIWQIVPGTTGTR
jgi:hypothetical protein